MEKFKYVIYLKLLLFSCMQIQLTAQNNIIPNGDFENSSGDCSGTGSAFNSAVQNWKVSMDGPSSTDPNTKCVKTGASCLQSTAMMLCSGGNATANNKVLLLRKAAGLPIIGNRSCDLFRQDHAGVALENGQKFNTGKNFIIRYKLLPVLGEIQESDILQDCSAEVINTHLRFFLSVNGPENWEDNGNTTQEIFNANFQQTNSLQSFPPCDWKIVQRNFTSASDDFTTLVILVESGGVMLDEVEVFEDCESDYLIQNKKYLSGSYLTNSINGFNFREASGNNLTAGNNVGKPNTNAGNVTIEMFSNVIYTAPNEIRLKPGFEALNNSEFKGVIAGCSTFVNRFGNNNDLTEGQNPDFATATKNLAQEAFIEPKLAPNPGNGIYYIQTSKDQNYSIDIYDMRGGLIKTQTIEDGNAQVDIMEYCSGLYTFIIKTNTYSKVIKVIKMD